MSTNGGMIPSLIDVLLELGEHCFPTWHLGEPLLVRSTLKKQTRASLYIIVINKFLRPLPEGAYLWLRRRNLLKFDNVEVDAMPLIMWVSLRDVKDLFHWPCSSTCFQLHERGVGYT